MNSSLGFLHYTGDFFITVMLVLATVKEPCVVLHDAFIELIGGVVLDEETTAYVERQAREHCPGGTRFEHLHVFKTGMKYTVDVYLTVENERIDVSHLMERKRNLEKVLSERFELLDVNFVFD